MKIDFEKREWARILDSVDFWNQSAYCDLVDDIISNRNRPADSEWQCRDCPEDTSKPRSITATHYDKMLWHLQWIYDWVREWFPHRNPEPLLRARRHYQIWHAKHSGENLPDDEVLEADFYEANLLVQDMRNACKNGGTIEINNEPRLKFQGREAGYLGLIVVPENKTVQRIDEEHTIRLQGKNNLWTLFLALYESGDNGVTKAEVMQKYDGSENSLPKDKNTLKGELFRLGLTIPNAHSGVYRIAEDAKNNS